MERFNIVSIPVFRLEAKVHIKKREGDVERDITTDNFYKILVICINPPDHNGQPYKPWRFRDSPAAAAAKAQALALENPEQTVLGAGFVSYTILSILLYPIYANSDQFG